VRPIDEVQRARKKLFIGSFHTFLCQWTRVLYFAVRRSMEHSSWAEFLVKLRILGVKLALWFLFGIQVIEIAEKFIEAVVGWQVFITITEMVLTELPRHVAVILQ